MCKIDDYSNIFVVTNRKLSQGKLLQRLETLCKKGVGAVILREKDMGEPFYRELAKQVITICEQYHVPCILHSFYEVAAKMGRKEIHLPLSVLKEKEAFLRSHFTTIGVSVHSVEEAVQAQKLGATYITAGHIFATDCKMGLEPRGLTFLHEVCSAVTIPVYGIGGIHRENAALVLMAGAKGVCMMSDAMYGKI